MDKDNVNDSLKAEGFWARQFNSERTSSQTAFDAIAGIFLPIVCFVFDPIVFRSIFGTSGAGQLTKYQIFAYVAMPIGLIMLGVWLILGERTKSWSGFLSGVFFSGSVLAFAVGVALLPLSIIGLAFVIGILGFVPFLTSFVFIRNGYRALNVAKKYVSRSWIAGSIVLGVLLAIVFPSFVQWQTSQIISQSVQQIFWGDEETSEKAGKRLEGVYTTIPTFTQWQTTQIVSGLIQQTLNGDILVTDSDIQRLKQLDWCSTCFDEIVRSYVRETDEDRLDLLARFYRRITGNDIEVILMRWD